MGRSRGRRITDLDREKIIILIDEARKSGCRLKIAAVDIGIDFKTYLRWKSDPFDRRKGPIKVPKNKLTKAEKDKIISVLTDKFCHKLGC